MASSKLDQMLKDAKYPSCVGLSWQGGWLDTAIRRNECWTDMVSRPWPWYLRFIPTSWVSWDTNGARFKLFHKGRLK